MTITLTAREREVFASMIDYVRKRCANQHGINLSGNAIARWMEDWLASQTTETSASPPRVPVSSVCRHDDGSDRDPLVPGQPTEYERDYLTGIEAAAREVDRLADEEGLLPHHFSAAIRALADKPAPDAARKGG